MTRLTTCTLGSLARARLASVFHGLRYAEAPADIFRLAPSRSRRWSARMPLDVLAQLRHKTSAPSRVWLGAPRTTFAPDAAMSGDLLALNVRIVDVHGTALGLARIHGRAFLHDFAWKSGAVNGAVRAVHRSAYRSPSAIWRPPVTTDHLGSEVFHGHTRELASAVSPDDRATMVIDRRPAVERDHNAERLVFWDLVALATHRKVGSLCASR